MVRGALSVGALKSTCEEAGWVVVQVMVALERVMLLVAMSLMTGGTAVAVRVGVGVVVRVRVMVRVGVTCCASLTRSGSACKLPHTSSARAQSSSRRPNTGAEECQYQHVDVHRQKQWSAERKIART